MNSPLKDLEDQKELKLKPVDTKITIPIDTTFEDGTKLLREYLFSFREYNKTRNAFTFRCGHRECGAVVRVYLKGHYEYYETIADVEYHILITKNITWEPVNQVPHCCPPSQKPKEKEKAQEGTITKTFRKDPQAVKEYISNHPNFPATKIQVELQKQGIQAAKSQIENELTRVNRSIYPKDVKDAFNPTFCMADDGTQFFQGLIEVPYQVKDKIRYTKIAILGSRFMLQRLGEAEEWYIDGTFWSSPPEFKQIINILIHSDRLNRYVCCIHILVNSKKKEEYKAAFQNLVDIGNNYGYRFKPKFIMTDFEESLTPCRQNISILISPKFHFLDNFFLTRSALEEIFPKTCCELLGCEFHFLQALWKKAAKEGLKKKELKTKTARLITILLILVHVKDEEAKQRYWKEIRDQTVGDYAVYNGFLNYFAQRWLTKKFIELGEKRHNQERTNNCCEGYHAYLKKLIGKPHPRCGYLIKQLQEYEYRIRSDLISSYSNALSLQKSPERDPPELPITKLLNLNIKIQDQLSQNSIGLLQVLKEKQHCDIVAKIARDLDTLFQAEFKGEIMEEIEEEEEAENILYLSQEENEFNQQICLETENMDVPRNQTKRRSKGRKNASKDSNADDCDDDEEEKAIEFQISMQSTVCEKIEDKASLEKSRASKRVNIAGKKVVDSNAGGKKNTFEVGIHLETTSIQIQGNTTSKNTRATRKASSKSEKVDASNSNRSKKNPGKRDPKDPENNPERKKTKKS